MPRSNRRMEESLARQGLLPRDRELSDAELSQAADEALAAMNEPLDLDLESVSPAHDQDLIEANNPDVRSLGEPPLLGSAPASSDIFGSQAQNVGQASSPLLYSQISNFPTAVQFRVWRWENGVPVAIGAIDCNATEDDFLEEFYHAMPKPGDRKFQFRLRPIDQRARELGKEITINISEHHATLKRLREREQREKEVNHGGYRNDPLVLNQNDGHASAVAAEEMGRMFEHALGAAESRANLLAESLEEERDRLRAEERMRVEERLKQAENASGVVEKLTEKLMDTDRQRSKEALESQRSSTDLMVHTLTTVFDRQSQSSRETAERQAQMQREMAERQRLLDEHRLSQDRDFFERQRQEMELRRQYEREEADRKRQEERDRLQAEVARKEKEMEARMERDRMELQFRREQEQAERERFRAEAEERRRQETAEFERKLLLAREEAERQRAREQEDRDRRARDETARWERERLELQERTTRERLEYERKRDEERAELERRRQEERAESERRDRILREEALERENRRKEELAMQLKQMDLTAQRDREHAERMIQMAAQEREAQREAALAREKAEREDREFRETERQRKHELQLREMELQRDRDREHQERMLQLSKVQTSGLGGLTDLLGMKAPELLERIFVGPGGEDTGGEESGGTIWEKIPGMIGSLADAAKVMMQRQGPPPPMRHAHQPALPQFPNFQQGVPVQPVPAPVPVQPQAQAQPREPVAREPVAREPGPSVSPAPSEKPLTPYAETELALEQGKENLTARAKAAGMELAAIKKSRKAIRDLVKKLPNLTDEKGKEAVMVAALANPEAITYIEAVSVFGALAEAKAGEELANRIRKVLEEALAEMNATVPLTFADVKAKEAP